MTICSKCSGFYPKEEKIGTICVWCSIYDRLKPDAPDGVGNTNGQSGSKETPNSSNKEKPC